MHPQSPVPPQRQAFPWGKVPPKGADEGLTGHGFRLRAGLGGFAAPAASDFLCAQKVTKEALKGAAREDYGALRLGPYCHPLKNPGDATGEPFW